MNLTLKIIIVVVSVLVVFYSLQKIMFWLSPKIEEWDGQVKKRPKPIRDTI